MTSLSRFWIKQAITAFQCSNSVWSTWPGGLLWSLFSCGARQRHSECPLRPHRRHATSSSQRAVSWFVLPHFPHSRWCCNTSPNDPLDDTACRSCSDSPVWWPGSAQSWKTFEQFLSSRFGHLSTTIGRSLNRPLLEFEPPLLPPLPPCCELEFGHSCTARLWMSALTSEKETEPDCSEVLAEKHW